jgi:serine/threonine-protein kinase Chk2
MTEALPWAHLISLSKSTPDNEINSDIFTIGRKDFNNFQIRNSKVSGRHCIITREKEADNNYTYYVEDVSANGTFHNGSKIGKQSKMLLVDGDEIVLLSKQQIPGIGM